MGFYRYILEVKWPRPNDGFADELMKTDCCNRGFGVAKGILKFSLQNIRFEIFIRYSST